jgi:protein ImuB
VEDTEGLLFAARRLLGELAGFLLARDGGVQELRLRFWHAAGDPSNIAVGLLRPARATEHFFDLLRQRLERLELPAPVTELELWAGPVEPLAASSRGLFPRVSGEREDGERLLERFQARLGEKRVCGLELRADHRPEYAWSYCAPGQTRPAAHRRRRPLWLLPQPQPLLARDGWPWREGGKLELEPERERIETGWWDGREVRRDYFVAHARNGERLWIFRELHGAGRWFLHGIFG